MKITFPSGRTVFIQPVVSAKHEPNAEAKSRIEKRRHACKHVGKSVRIDKSCSGNVSGGVWECDLHERCAPLAIVSVEGVCCVNCPDYERASEPGLIRLAINYSSAVAAWTVAGMPTRTQEQVNTLFAICNSCPFLSRPPKGAAHCGKCGCPVNTRIDDPTKNKLAMATESCPLSPPKWTAEV